MNDRPFDDVTFGQALARARAREAAELALAATGLGPKPSGDIGDTLRRLAQEHHARVLATWHGSQA